MTDAARKLSKDLIPIYRLEIERGNQVIGEYEPAGTECPYALVLRDPIDAREVERRLSLPDWIHYWSSTDPHYALEAGYYSKVSKHAIAGPLPPDMQRDQTDRGA